MIVLPFPPSSLSGHQGGHWRDKAAIVRKHRDWARVAALAAKLAVTDGEGDIRVAVAFFPPDRRGDRCNYPNRMKPYFDGLADALKVNDRRFVPAFEFHAPDKIHPRVEIELSIPEDLAFLQPNYGESDSASIAGMPQ